MVPIDRPACPHCDPFRIHLEAISRELDEIQRKVERRCNELLIRHIAILLHGPAADEQRPN
jgi:hypothetical protein